MSTRILVIDDKENIRKLLFVHLDAMDYEVEVAENAEIGLEMFRENVFEIVITDVRMPGKIDGLQLLGRVKELNPDTAVIVMTAFADTDDAINALKRGAADYLKKPFKLKDIQSAVEKALSTRRLMTENRLLRREVEKKYNFSNIIASSEVMMKVFQMIEKVSASNSTVLVTGETGAGKELVAWAIHDHSPRRDRPFVVVNCAAIPPTLLESELFGHARGAFTDARHARAGMFEEADGGTVFLDEVGEIGTGIQAKLLRVLENGEITRIGENKARQVDVRVLAATNANLEAGVQNGSFRKDLFYRLNVLPIKIPPLRERREDIPLLARHFLDKTCRENKLPLKFFATGAMGLLLNYEWPGNVRELYNLVERCVLMADQDEIAVADLPENIRQDADIPETAVADASIPLNTEDLSIKKNVSRIISSMEKDLIKAALEKTGGNKDKAAELLEISRRSLFYKLKEYDINN